MDNFFSNFEKEFFKFFLGSFLSFVFHPPVISFNSLNTKRIQMKYVISLSPTISHPAEKRKTSHPSSSFRPKSSNKTPKFTHLVVSLVMGYTTN